MVDIVELLTGGRFCKPIESDYKSRELIREQCANLCHEQWSHWMKYLFSKCDFTMPNVLSALHNDSLVISPDLVKHWKKQMETPYSELSESEQDSDRKEADKFIALFNNLEK